jgi:hypothetical protein
MKMDINELTVGQLKEIQGLCGASKAGSEYPYKLGQAYPIRTVTHHYIGVLKWIGPT